MAFLEHWVRDPETKERIFTKIPDEIEHNNLKEKVDGIQVTIPYVQQAFQVILFSLTNSRNYPQTRDAIETQDNIFKADNSYNGLTEGAKAQLLIDTLLE